MFGVFQLLFAKPSFTIFWFMNVSLLLYFVFGRKMYLGSSQASFAFVMSFWRKTFFPRIMDSRCCLAAFWKHFCFDFFVSETGISIPSNLIFRPFSNSTKFPLNTFFIRPVEMEAKKLLYFFLKSCATCPVRFLMKSYFRELQDW